MRERERDVQASSISLWHSSRYKTLILTNVPLGAFQRQLRPRRVDGGTQQVARCAAVHSAGSQLPLRVLGMYLCRAPETRLDAAEIGDQALTGRTSLL